MHREPPKTFSDPKVEQLFNNNKSFQFLTRNWVITGETAIVVLRRKGKFITTHSFVTCNFLLVHFVVAVQNMCLYLGHVGRAAVVESTWLQLQSLEAGLHRNERLKTTSKVKRVARRRWEKPEKIAI